MKTPKEIFDNRYLYYRDGLGRPAIPLEARQLIFNVMQEYANETVKNLPIPVVVGTLCEHNWHHLDNHSDRMMCIKCDKRI